jgi:hypothetical protein
VHNSRLEDRKERSSERPRYRRELIKQCRVRRRGLDSGDSGQAPVSDSVKTVMRLRVPFLDILSDCYFLKKDSAPWS